MSFMRVYEWINCFVSECLINVNKYSVQWKWFSIGFKSLSLIGQSSNFITFYSIFTFLASSVQLCNESLQHIAISSIGSESSVIVDLNSNAHASQAICHKTFLAEPRHAFFIRVLRYSRPQYAIVNEMQKIEWSKKHMPNFRKTKEYSCPLEIVSIRNPLEIE